jgi:hypothetical protein
VLASVVTASQIPPLHAPEQQAASVAQEDPPA